MLRSMLKKFPTLERYNQIIWAIIGSGMVVAVAVSVLVGVAAMLFSLLGSGSRGMQVAVIEENAVEGAGHKSAMYDFCQPLAVRDSPYQLIRVVSDQFAVRKFAADSKMKKMAYDSYSESPINGACRIYGSDKQTGTVNVIIRSVDDNSMHLLLKENAVIQTLEYPQPRVKGVNALDDGDFPPVGTLYWEIAFGDSNDDKIIDEKDDQGAYLSDPDGEHLARVTPVPSRVLEKSYDWKRGLLVLRILRDTNNDKMLDDKDKPSLIEVSVAKRKMTREVLDMKALTSLMQQAEPGQQLKRNQ